MVKKNAFFGFKYTQRRQYECKLFNYFSIGMSKMAIYISMKEKSEQKGDYNDVCRYD